MRTSSKFLLSGALLSLILSVVLVACGVILSLRSIRFNSSSGIGAIGGMPMEMILLGGMIGLAGVVMLVTALFIQSKR